MEFAEFQDKCQLYDVQELNEIGPYATVLLMQADVGTLSNKLYNALLDDTGVITADARNKLAISLSDVLFDLSMTASKIGVTLDQLSALTLRKHDLINQRAAEDLKLKSSRNPNKNE